LPGPAFPASPGNQAIGFLSMAFGSPRDALLSIAWRASPPAYGVDEFEAVAGLQVVIGVAAARDDLTVDLDGHAASCIAGLVEQARNGGARRAIVRSAVEIDLHAGNSSRVSRNALMARDRAIRSHPDSDALAGRDEG